MPETAREAGSQLLLLLLPQLQKPGKKRHRRRRPKRNRRPSRSRRLMPLLFYLRHNRAKGKGKGKGTPRGTSRSASPSPKDKKKIPCHFHFAKQSCKKGNDCEYSHDQKVFGNNKKGGGKGKGKSKSPRKRTPSNTPKKIDETCWNWAKGKCKFCDSCRRRHDPHLFNTAPNTSNLVTPAHAGSTTFCLCLQRLSSTYHV